MISFECKNCGQKFTVDDAKAGKKGKCHKCGKVVVIPITIGNKESKEHVYVNPNPQVDDSQPYKLKEETKYCPFCGEEILEEAIECLHCGEFLSYQKQVGSQINNLKLKENRCKHCGSTGIGKVRGLQGFAEVFLVIFLFFIGVIPAIIYYLYIRRVPYCGKCGRRVYK